MNKLKNIIIILLLVSTGAVFAQNARLGTAGATELLIPVGARGVAMGGAVLTSTFGANAIFWNPANISRAKNSVDILASYQNYIADIGVQYGAVAVNAGEFGTLGFSLKSYSMGDIIKTTVENPDGTGQTFTPQFFSLGVSYSKLLTDRVSVGLNINYISEKLDLVSASGIGFDFGVDYSSVAGIKGFDLAIIMKNIGPNMKYDGSGLWIRATADDQRRGKQFYKISTADFSLPTSLAIGLGYTLSFNDQNNLRLVGSFTNNNYYLDEYKVGGEYSFNDMLFLRGGYTYTPNANSSDLVYTYSLGFGLRYNVGGSEVEFDYAYSPAQYFNDTHLFSLGIGL